VEQRTRPSTATPTSAAPTTRARSTRTWPALPAFSQNNKFFEDDALAGYGIVTMVARAVGEVGNDPAAIAKYLHENTFDIPGYSFELRWTEWGELADARIAFDLIGRGPAPEGVNEAGTWYPERLLVSEPLEPFRPPS
jgi:ABC-type branched-subunit amino acid transport system substrate-binding protein